MYKNYYNDWFKLESKIKYHLGLVVKKLLKCCERNTPPKRNNGLTLDIIGIALGKIKVHTTFISGEKIVS